MSVRDARWWATGAALGAALVLLGLPVLRVDAAPAPPSASIEVLRSNTGELAVTRPGMLLRTAALRPGAGPVSGTAIILNQTARPLRVRARVRPLRDELDGAVLIGIDTGARRLARGALDSRAPWSRGSVVLQPLERTTVAVTVQPVGGLPADRFAGRETQARLELHSRVAAG